VTGRYFIPSDTDTINWYDHSTNQTTLLATVTVSMSGVLQASVTAPQILSKGNTHDGEINGHTIFFAQTPFIE